MLIKHQKDFWAGVMFLVLGAGFAYGATNYNFGTSARPGPAYFPFGLGLLTAALGTFEIIKAVLSKQTDGDIGPWPLKQMAVIISSIVLFGLALPLLGLVVSLGLLILVSTLSDNESNAPAPMVLVILLLTIVLAGLRWFGVLPPIGTAAVCLALLIAIGLMSRVEGGSRDAFTGAFLGALLAAFVLAVVLPVLNGLVVQPILRLVTPGNGGASVGLLGSLIVIGIPIICRLILLAAVVYSLFAFLPSGLRSSVRPITLSLTLIVFCQWVFVDGLSLTIPSWPNWASFTGIRN
jgi:hypothetical protein